MQYIRSDSGTSFEKGTPAEVVDVLERARKQGFRVRIWLGDKSTGRAWTEDADVTGYVGRSTGPIRVPLLLAQRRSQGGPAILTNAILAIKTAAGWEYTYPGLNLGEWRVDRRQGGNMAVLQRRSAQGEWVRYAVFTGPRAVRKAERLRDFMIGRRMSK